MEKNKFLNVKYIVMFLFILTYFFKSITDAIFVSKEIDSIFVSFKYIPMFLTFIFFFFFKKKNKQFIFLKELKIVFFIIFSFFVLSMFFSALNLNFTVNTISLLIKMIFAVIFAFVILNSLTFDDIYKCLKFILIFSIFGYVLEIGINNFNISNIMSMNFSSSYSPFESAYFAGIAVAMTTFYCFFRKEKIWLIFSIIFTIFTFKRLSILFSLLLLVLPWFLNIDKKINKKFLIVFSFIFIFLTILYFNLLRPDNSELFFNIFSDTQTKFTMGRSDRLQYLLNNNFSSYGWGSGAHELGLELIELDLIEIFLELSIVGLFVFVFSLWRLTNCNLYLCVYMMFIMFNLLTSHSLGSNFSWTITYIIIGSVSYYQSNIFVGNRPKFLNKIKLKFK